MSESGSTQQLLSSDSAEPRGPQESAAFKAPATESDDTPLAPPIGARIEALWSIIYDENDATDGDANTHGSVDYKWWGAVVQDCMNEAVGSRCPEYSEYKIHVILYDAYNDFPEEAARVVFLPNNVLMQLAMMDDAQNGKLDWRLEGAETDATDEERIEPTVHSAVNLAQEADYIVREAGLHNDADLQELAKMPHNVQLHVTSGYRSFADGLKALLAELMASRPAGYVVTEQDMNDILSRLRSNSNSQQPGSAGT